MLRTKLTAHFVIEKGEIKSIVAIRGVAVLLVMLCHLFSDQALDITTTGLSHVTRSMGHIGVTLFFTVSGFVLPYSMYRSDYHFSGFPRYLLRRAVRIEPPYLVSIVLVLVCMFAKELIGQSVNYNGDALGVFTQVLYLNDILGLPWLNIVYWTLALEFQFYLLIGLVFPLLKHLEASQLIAGLVMICALKLLGTGNVWIFYYLPFFVIGYGFCAYQLKKITSGHLTGFLFICILMNSFHNDTLYAIIDVVTIGLFIVFFCREKVGFPSWLLFVGQISYSVYLIHNIMVAGLGTLDPLQLGLTVRIILSILTLLLAFIPSFLFYKYVEKPFHLKAQMIRKRDRIRRLAS